VLVTGASRGIGRFLAERYIAAGCSVIGCSRGETDLTTQGYEHHQLDVADEAAVCEMFRQVRKRRGRVDVLINNAAITTMNHALLTPASTARAVLDVNVLGTFLCCREAAKLMRSNGGRIINFSTTAVPLNLEGEAIYAASKAAVVSLTEILARELADFGITVNAVGPCPVDTAMTRPVPDTKMKAVLDRQAISRYAELEDVANVVDFFMKPESRLITGQVLYLGGV